MGDDDMDADAVFNIVALVMPLVVAYCGIVAYLRIERAIGRRMRFAKMGREPFHPTQLPLQEHTDVRNSSGQTPGEWFMERSVDVAHKRGGKLPTRLDYLREFHPEKLERRKRS